MITQERNMTSIEEKPARRRIGRQPQSAAAATLPDAHLRVQTVIEITGRSEATIYRDVASGKFPAPLKFGARCTRWRAGDVTDWLRAQAATASRT